MSFHSHLDWPFFENRHREFGEPLALWAERGRRRHIDHRDVDGACRGLIHVLGEAGWQKVA